MPAEKNSNYTGPISKSKKAPVRPKNVNKNIKVSQSEINSIKKLGMKQALKIASMNKGSEQAGAVASFAEGVRRLYGDTRYQNATYTPKASPGPSTSNFTYNAPVAPRVAKPNEQRREPSKTASKPKTTKKADPNWSPGLHNIPNPISAITKLYGNK